MSVLFADLVGFTTLSAGRDAEEVRELQSRYFDLASETVVRYGGTVEKFIGDAVMAVWGTPIAHEDDAERAVRAALDLVDHVRELGVTTGTALEARAGVLTGEAAVNLGASNQGMVAGDLVNTASRIQSLAPPGAVLVGEATHGATASAIAFEAAGEHLLKGKEAPVAVFRALRVVATVGGALRTESLEPPFVGRDTEFRLLRDLFHATARERRARLVSLVGQAGIGKSRLAWEFHKYLDGVVETVFWHHGRSPSYGTGVSFWALGEMVRKRAGLAETDDPATTRDRISATLDTFVPDAEERRFVEPALLALLGVDEAPPGGSERLFAGWRTFLERIADQGAVALVFEDLQWADDGLLDFIEHLLEWSRSYPIFVVTMSRPELLDRNPTWAARRDATVLALSPLAEADMRALLAGLVPGLSESVIRAILSRADGIPLYAVETVRMLVADGRLEPADEGTFRPTGTLGELEVPPSLHALIAARLDALHPTDRTLLQDASILGQSFTLASLEAVTGEHAGALEPRLRGLVQQDLLTLDTDPRSPERGQYGFVQALIREVAYGTFARKERRARHLAAARYYEALGDDELAGALAGHYLAAHQAAPGGPEGLAAAIQARIALRGAAERAVALGSAGLALDYLQRAIDLPGGEPGEDVDLMVRASETADLAGDYTRGEALGGRAVEAARAIRDPERLSAGFVVWATNLSRMGQGDRSRLVMQEGLVDLEASPSSLARARLEVRLASMLLRDNESAAAMPLLERVLPLAERDRDMPLFVEALIGKGSSLTQQGRSMEGMIVLEGARRVAEEQGLTAQLLRAMVNHLIVLMDEDPGAAISVTRDGLAIAARYGMRTALVSFLLNGTECAIHTGDWDWAAGEIEQTFAGATEPYERVAMGVSRIAFALLRGGSAAAETERFGEDVGGMEDVQARIMAGDAAMWHAFVASDHARLVEIAAPAAATDPLNGPTFYWRAARAALWLEDAPRAVALIEALEGLGRGAPFVRALLTTLHAGLAALEGRRRDAVDGYHDAARRWTDLGCVFDAALCQLDAARFLGTTTMEGAAAAKEARALFERLGSPPFLAQLGALKPADEAATGLTRSAAGTAQRVSSRPSA